MKNVFFDTVLDYLGWTVSPFLRGAKLLLRLDTLLRLDSKKKYASNRTKTPKNTGFEGDFYDFFINF